MAAMVLNAAKLLLHSPFTHPTHSGKTGLSNSLFSCYNMMLSYTPGSFRRSPSLPLPGPSQLAVGLQQKLGQLGGLARSCLAHKHHRLIALDELQELLPATWMHPHSP